MDGIIEAATIGMAAGIAGGILAVLAAMPWRREAESPKLFAVIAPLMIGAVFTASLLFVEGWPGWKPAESWWSLLHIAAAATILPTVGALLPRCWWRSAIFMAATAIVAAALLRAPTIVERANQTLLWKLVLGGSIVAGWLVFEPLARRHRGALVPLGLSVVFVALFGLVLGRMGFARAAPGLPAVAATLGLIAISASIKPKLQLAGGAITTAVTLGGGTLVIAWMHQGTAYSGTPWWTPLAVAASPAALWLAELPVLGKLRPWARAGLAVGAVILIAGGAVALALVMKPADPYAGY